ncbi:MAG: hypothetical protein JO030_06380 [Candidatus Eremiobacteraeota bacterium]|nr:hypothetical protein [Candidatus Eremiobacteraeota bacterium]
MVPRISQQSLQTLQKSRAGQFARLRRQPPVGMVMEWLMTDGSVLAQSVNQNTWYRYAPDAKGNYSDGTWAQVATLPSRYGPLYFASDVLADGRFAISGGEYNSPGNGYQLQLTNLGAIYDPVKNVWTPLGRPTRWKYIGDSPSSVLPNGDMLVGDKLHKWDAHLNPKTLSWTKLGDAGKSDFNAEEGWTLLPSGEILTADVKNAPNSEVYNAATGTWKSAGSTIVDLHSPSPYGCLMYGPGKCYYPPGEIGPAILRPDGTVFYTGSYSNAGPGHTAIYNSVAGTWKVGPDFPNGDNAGDSYATLEPSGDVLVFGVSGAVYEWNGSTLNAVNGISYTGPPLLLPSGQVMVLSYSGVGLYTPTGQPQSSWLPTISKVSATLKRGATYKITGTQFNGFGQAMSYGDENQNATNYPLVRITNNSTGDVFYARTHDHSTMGVATGSKPVSTHFDVPAKIQTGPSTLVVVANGIASKAVAVTVK